MAAKSILQGKVGLASIRPRADPMLACLLESPTPQDVSMDGNMMLSANAQASDVAGAKTFLSLLSFDVDRKSVKAKYALLSFDVDRKSVKAK